MPIKFKCQCGKPWKVADKHAGKRTKCPACGKTLQIPTPKTLDTLAKPESEVIILDQCQECGGEFPKENVVNDRGKIICRQCFHKSSQHAAKVKKLVLLSSCVIILIAAIYMTLHFFSSNVEQPNEEAVSEVSNEDSVPLPSKKPQLTRSIDKSKEAQTSGRVRKDLLVKTSSQVTNDKVSQSFSDQPPGEVLSLHGHTDHVNAAAFSPDGTCAISASSDETIRLWDVKTGKQIRQFGTKGNGVNCIVFFPDGNRVISGHSDGMLRIWNVNTGKELRRLKGKELRRLKGLNRSVESVALSGDGRYAVSDGPDSTVRLWDVEKGKVIRILKSPTIEKGTVEKGSVSSVAFSRDGQKIAAGIERHASTSTKDRFGFPRIGFETFGIVCVWKLDVKKKGFEPLLSDELRRKNIFITSVQFSPDSRQLLFAELGRFWLWAYKLKSLSDDSLVARDRPEVRSFRGHTEPDPEKPGFYHFSRVSGLTFSPDGRRVLSGGYDNTLRLWDSKSAKELSKFSAHTGPVKSVAFSPDGHLAISASEDNTIRIWKLPEHQEQPAVAALDEAKPEDTTGNIPSSIESKGKDEPLDDQHICLLGHTDAVEEVAFSPDSTCAISASLDETIRLWDVKTGKEIRQFGTKGSGVYCIAFFPDGKRVISGHSDGSLRIWNVSTGQELHRIAEQGERVETVALSPNGRYAILGRLHQPYLEFWDTETGELIQNYCLGRSNSSGFDPLAKSPQTLSSDNNYGISHVAFSPDGLKVAAALERTPRGREKVAAALERTPRGRELEQSRSDGSVYVIFEFYDGKPEYQLRRGAQHIEGGPVVCVRFSPNNHQLLYSGLGWIKAWDFTSELQDNSSQKSRRKTLSIVNFKPSDKRPGHYSLLRVSGLDFSPDGRRALSGGSDNTVRLWNVQTGKELRRFSGHTKAVNSVAFSPDGSMAISGGQDKTVRLWDVGN